MASQTEYDGQDNFLGGQDSSKNPDQISAAHYWASVNTLSTKGSLGPRWGMHQKELDFEEGNVSQVNLYTKSYEEVFETGKFQLIDRYLVGSKSYILIVISGIIYLVDPADLSVQILELPANDVSLDEYAERLNGSQAGEYYVIYDWPAYPVILDGLTAKRADPALDEVPISVLGAYNQNRLFIVNAGNEYTAGDPAGSLAAPDAPITFQEFLTPASAYFGQAFKLPTAYDNEPITAVGFLPVVDTSTGIGPLLLSTKDQIFSAQAQLPRAQWEASTFTTLFVDNSGIAGQEAFIPVGSDIYYKGGDGQIRTISMSREEQRRWAKVPISREVQNWLKRDVDSPYNKYSALGYFNNKVFATVNPVRTKAISINNESIPETCYGGMVVFSLDNLTNLGAPSTPAWDGLWTGVRPMGFVTIGNRFFVISKDNYRVNKLYEVMPNLTYDVVDNQQIRYVRSIMYSREYDWGAPQNNKELRNISFILEDVKGDFNLDVKYRSGDKGCFYSWTNFCHKAPWRLCAAPQRFISGGLVGHDFNDLNLGSPVETAYNPITGEDLTTFKRLQLRLEIVGRSWSIHSYKMAAVISPENDTQAVRSSIDGECPYQAKEIYDCCNTDWNIEGIDLCQVQQT